jgi:hypothetical protein
MKEELKYNLINYLYEKNKVKTCWVMVITFLLIILFIIFMFYKIYDVENVNAQVFCEEENCKIMYYHYIDFNSTYDFVKINNQKYEIEELNYSDLSLDNSNNTYQSVLLYLDNYRGNNNEIVKIKLYKNKEFILKKIWHIIVER